MADENLEAVNAESATAQVVKEESTTSEETQTQEKTETKVAEPTGAEKRIKQLIAQNKELQRKLAEGDGKKATPTAPAPPKQEDFQNYDDFLIAKAKFEVKQETESEKFRTAIEDLDKQHSARMAKAAEKDPEIFEIQNDPDLPITQPMAIAIKGSDLGPEIVRYLADNRVEAARIAHLNPIFAAREIGKIEAKLSNPTPAKNKSSAPKPITTVEGVGVELIDEEKLPMSEFVKRRNEAQYGKRR